MITDLSMC